MRGDRKRRLRTRLAGECHRHRRAYAERRRRPRSWPCLTTPRLPEARRRSPACPAAPDRRAARPPRRNASRSTVQDRLRLRRRSHGFRPAHDHAGSVARRAEPRRKRNPTHHFPGSQRSRANHAGQRPRPTPPAHTTQAAPAPTSRSVGPNAALDPRCRRESSDDQRPPSKATAEVHSQRIRQPISGGVKLAPRRAPASTRRTRRDPSSSSTSTRKGRR